MKRTRRLPRAWQHPSARATGYVRAAGVVAVGLVLSGCSNLIPRLDEVLPDQTREYRRSESLPDLEVPPDLSTESIQDTMAVPDIDASGTATFSTYQERISARRRARSENASDTAAIQALADEQVVQLPGRPTAIWPRLEEWWRDAGFTLDLSDAELGVLETDWREDAATLTRDRYKLFVEPTADGTGSVVYLSHLIEAQTPEGENLVWRAQPRDTAVEKATARRLQSALGGGEEPVVDAPATPREASAATAAAASEPAAPGTGAAELVSAGGGKLYLRIDAAFASAWSAVGSALATQGFSIVEEDRGRGIYYVRATATDLGGEEKKGMLSRLAFWDDGEVEYQVSLTGVGERTEVVILDDDGNWDTSPGAAELLQRVRAGLPAGPG